MGLEQAVHLLAKSSPKHSAQYGFSSREVNRWPAKDELQLVQVKHSRCQGSLRYVTPPLLMICDTRQCCHLQLDERFGSLGPRGSRIKRRVQARKCRRCLRGATVVVCQPNKRIVYRFLTLIFVVRRSHWATLHHHSLRSHNEM